ncbi:hypothetical protein F5Y14DRAFT_451211 [Nemania sp. NC0429]|nr:hypothetical protein F5Y14DRAFT_451211 [Nemania sp. NC0429]
MASRAQTGIRFRSFPAKKQGNLVSDDADDLESDSVRLISHRVPALLSGNYTANFKQNIKAPDGTSETLTTEQQFAVRVPQLRLDPNVDIHSVFPAPGHSGYGNTLPHVVFKNPELPWERSVSSHKPDSFNKIPWLAILTFTADELLVPIEGLRRWQMHPQQSPTYTSSVTAGHLREPAAPGLLSPVQWIQRDFKDSEMVECIMIKPELFKALFGSYANGAATSAFSGKPDLDAFSYLAHVRSVHPHAMASTSPGDTELELSLVMGHRVAPVGLEHPINMISHVVSLEGLDKLDFSNSQPEYIGLVSLHSWSWMALPPDHGDLVDILKGLGKSSQPLRMKDEFLDSLINPEHPEENAKWLHTRLGDGYLLKRSTSAVGEVSTVSFRGPFTPTLPVQSSKSIKAWATSGEDLRLIDERTGIVDLSYQAAWELGRLLAVGDDVFTTSLLRLRGRIHSEASRLVRENADDEFVDMSEFTSQFPSAISHIVRAHKSENVRVGRMNSTLRWCSGQQKQSLADGPPDPTARICDVMNTPQYYKKLADVAKHLTRAQGNVNDPHRIYSEENDPISHDWANILSWAMDVLFADKIPYHYLIPDPESLPRESIRTFFVDPVWLECVIDGALSLASHFEHADFAITRELKAHINEYLRTPQDVMNGKIPRLPKWGFLMRSVAISSCPDLRIEAPLQADDTSGQSEILFMQRISEDVIVCLTDRIPGETTFTEVLISQPGHQHGFSFGDTLDDQQVSLTFKRLPTKPGATIDPKEREVPMTWRSKRQGGDPLPIFDWKNRTIIMTEFSKQCMAVLKKQGYFEWENGSPSSIISTQLTCAASRLGITAAPDPSLQQCLNDPAKSPWLVEDGARQIYVPDDSEVVKPSLTAPPSKQQLIPATLPHVDLPVGHRPQPERTAEASASPVTTRTATELPRFDYRSFYMFNDYDFQYRNMGSSNMMRFEPSVDCFPLHLGKEKTIEFRPSAIGAPMDVVFVAKGRIDEGWRPYEILAIEWLIPVDFPSATLTDKFADPKVQAPLFRIGGTVDHPELPTVEPVNIGLKWVYDVRLVYGTLMDWHEDEYQRYIGTPLPDAKNLQVLLVVRARPRDERHVEKAIDASFLLKNVCWHLPKEPPDGHMDVAAELSIIHSLYHEQNIVYNMATSTGLAPTFTSLPPSITSPPTIQFVPPSECNDPASNWVVTTSCYIELSRAITYPDWLTCTLTQFGNPSWYDPSCNIPAPTENPYEDAPKVTVDGVVSYYSGCPAGYSTARATSYPGWLTDEYENLNFDATVYSVQCCPTQYNFDPAPTGADPRQETSTLHDGVNYSLFLYLLPACAATSVSQLSHQYIPYRTWLNTMGWDRRRQVQTLSWDYDHGTMFAHQREFSYTVFQHTHTCYEQCDKWFTYCKRTLCLDYPNGVGGTPGPWPTEGQTTPTPTPTPEQRL